MSFDPDAFLAEQAAAAATAAPAFDPDAFLEEQANTAAPAFDPDAFLAEQATTTESKSTIPETRDVRSADTTANVRRRALEIFEQDYGRPATEGERAKIYQMDAEARGDTATAQKLSRDRANLDVAKLDEKTAEGQVAAVRKPYVFVRGAMGGITLGASDIALRKIEESAIGKPVQAESMGESMGEGVGRLLGSIFTGASIATGMAKPAATGTLVTASELGGGLTALIAKTGARPFAQLVATRAATSLATMAPQEAANVINGDKPIPDAIRDTAINALGSVVGAGPEIFVKAGLPNFLAQVTGQVAFDAATDALVTGRLTKETAQEWMINEIPNIATAVIFASKDLTDKDFATHQGKYRKDFLDMFSRKVKEQAIKKPFEYGTNVEEENAKRALKTHEETKNAIKESYPLDTHENVTAAITDLGLVPELTALHEQLDTIRLELKAGERVAGRIPQKNERGEIIGWMNSGAAYPGGMGPDTIPAIRHYLEGKPLTENQQRQLATAVKHSINELSGQAGFDIANQNPVYAEDLRTGDKLELSGEKFTVQEIDPDTGNITLKDGKLVTLKAGETILADRNSHMDADGNAPGQREAAPFDPDAFLREQEAERAAGDPTKATDEDISFNPDEFLAETAREPVRHDLGEGVFAEQTQEGHWEITDADGNRTRLDPEVADDHALIQQIDPAKRAAEVKRIATETAEKLPGAKIHFIDDEAAMNEVRANLGEAVKEIRAEDGTVRGFAVVGSNDYFILTRNMYPGEAARTVIHEAVGHIGVQGVLGDRIDTVLDGIYSSKTEHKATLERIARDYKLDLTTKKGQREATEELIAHIAERRDKDPGAWKRLVARMRDYFRQQGYTWAKDWTDNDIAALIQRGKERVSRPRAAITADINTGIRKAMTYATGNWDDAPRQQKVFENSSRRVYEVIRQGKTIYETVAKEGGKWKTVMYSDNIPEARDANFKKPEISRETSARKLLWYSIGQPWYARAIRSGLSPSEIFSSHTEIVKLIEDGVDAAPAVKLTESNSREYYDAKQSSEDLPIAAETGVRLAKNTSGLTQADRDMLLKSAKQHLYGRPDLSQVTTSKQTRDLVAEVDQSRNEKGQPTPQTFKSWKENADTRMQKDTTGEWLQFLSGKMHYEGDDAGQNTMVARKLLESKGLEAFASGADAEIAKVGAAIWGYRNTRSNLARALAAGRDFLETPAERNRRWIAEALYYPGAKVDRKLQGMDLKSMQGELQKRAGKMQEIRTKLLDMGIDLAKLDEKTMNDPAAMAEIVRQIQISNAGYGDMAYEYWRNGILSAFPTHAANIKGNILSTAWQYTAQKGTEALINSLTKSKSGTSFAELPGMYRALWGSLRPAARNAITAFSTEQGSIEGIRLDDKGVAIPGTLGRVIRTPQRALLAADEFSKTMILQAELYSRAHQEAYAKGWRGDGLENRIKEILTDPKSDMMNAAIEEARRLTFQAEPGEITSWLMKSRSIPGLQWVSKYVLPFVSTPTNIIKMGVRKSPLGILRMAKEAAQGHYVGNRQAFIRDSAEQMLAIASTFALISLVNDEDERGIPRITGSGPSGGKDAGKQQAEQRMTSAQSIRLGGRWYSYARIEPLATTITHTIDVINAIKNKPGEDASQQLGRVWSSMKSMARDKTFLATIGDIIRATEDDSKGISLIQNFGASWIPNVIRSGARATDPYYRSAKLMNRDDRGIVRELAANIGQAALPVASIQDAPRMDFWGRPLQKTEGFGPATDIIWRLVSPITVQHVHGPDNFDRMLFNYNRKAAQKGWDKYWPDMPGNAFELPGERGVERTARMNPDEYSRFLKRRGDFFFEQAAGTVWNFDNPKTMEIAQFKKFMSKATLLAKNDIYQERKMNPVNKSLKLDKEAKRQRPIIKPSPVLRPMMNLDETRNSL